MPAAHRAHQEWSPQRLIDCGARIGVGCAEVITRLLYQYKHPEHGYRACLGLLSLAKRFGQARLEAACERVLALGAFRYRHIRDMFIHGREQDSTQAPKWTSARQRQAGWPVTFPEIVGHVQPKRAVTSFRNQRSRSPKYALSLATISRGVPAGAKSERDAAMSKPLRPDSAKVGTSGVS